MFGFEEKTCVNKILNKNELLAITGLDYTQDGIESVCLSNVLNEDRLNKDKMADTTGHNK